MLYNHVDIKDYISEAGRCLSVAAHWRKAKFKDEYQNSCAQSIIRQNLKDCLYWINKGREEQAK